jgi:hypothetical protein
LFQELAIAIEIAVEVLVLLGSVVFGTEAAVEVKEKALPNRLTLISQK